MTEYDRAGFVLAHFGIPVEERREHLSMDARKKAGLLSDKSIKTYRAIYQSLSWEEIACAAERL